MTHSMRVNRMSPNEISNTFLINPSSDKAEIKKLTARLVFECFEIESN